MVQDPLLECLIWLAGYYHKKVSSEEILSGLPLTDRMLDDSLLKRAAENAGLVLYKKCLAGQPFHSLPQSCLPCMIWIAESPVILVGINSDSISIINPEQPMSTETLPVASVDQAVRNEAYLFSPVTVTDDRDPDYAPGWHQHWLWGALLEGRFIYREALLASLLINTLALAVPLFVRLVYDQVIPGLAYNTLYTLTSAVLLLVLFELSCRYLRNCFIDLAAKKSDLLISGRIFAKVMTMTMLSRPAAVGAFARQVQDFEAIREFLTSTSMTALVDIPFAILFLVVTGLIAGPLVWIPILAIVLMIILSLLIQPFLKHFIEESEKLSARRYGDLVESLTGLESLRLAGAQWRFQKRWEESVGHAATWGLKARKITGGITVVAVCLQQLITIGIVFFGVTGIASNAMSVGGLIAVMMLAGRAIAPFMQLALLATRYQQAKTAYQVIGQLMNSPDEHRDNHHYRAVELVKGRICCDQLSFAYPGSAGPALKRLSLTISPGEKVAIAGRSGSGKSTLARILAALYLPDEGRVYLDDMDINDIHPDRLRHNIGFLAQEPWLFHGTVKDNITLGCHSVADYQLLEVAEATGVTSFTGHSMAALDYPVGEGGQRLSGGQRRAVALARALLNKPNILILDEPTAHMDSLLEARVLKTLQTLPVNTTLLMMTHRRSLVAAVDRILVLEAGQLVTDKPVRANDHE